jgi:hypothetical protein
MSNWNGFIQRSGSIPFDQLFPKDRQSEGLVELLVLNAEEAGGVPIEYAVPVLVLAPLNKIPGHHCGATVEDPNCYCDC